MDELRLKFTDQNGEEKRITASGQRFIVGRHSESDLSIPDGRLSREHLKIERLGEDFMASDCGSSNGTTLNGETLTSPAVIKHGDIFLLGGEVRIIAEFASQSGDAVAAAEPETPEEPAAEVAAPTAIGAGKGSGLPVSSAGSRSGPSNVYWLLPIFGIVLVLFAGGLVYLAMAGKNKPVVASSTSDVPYSASDDEDDAPPVNKSIKDEKPDTRPTVGNDSGTSNIDSGNSSTNTPEKSGSGPLSTDLGATAKAEQHGAAFMRRIAQNDPRAFLTSEQAKRVNPKIKQFSGSSALAENINSARKNAAQIRSLAASKNLKPEFLAVAALAKLGSSRGDVVKTAGAMLEVLNKLKVQLNDEFANDCLLLIAVYEQGAAGDFLKLRNMLQELAVKHGDGVRAIRTIWFLEKNGKITAAEFDRALTFLAIGAITQNPKEFGVNAEALLL